MIHSLDTKLRRIISATLVAVLIGLFAATPVFQPMEAYAQEGAATEAADAATDVADEATDDDDGFDWGLLGLLGLLGLGGLLRKRDEPTYTTTTTRESVGGARVVDRDVDVTR